MSERDHYPAGVPCWVDTPQPDPESALDFYRELLGWQFGDPGAMPTDPPGHYWVARIGGRDVAGISSMPPGLPGRAVWNTYVSVDDVDETTEGASTAGGTVLAAPFDAPPAGRMAVIVDPTGAALCLWQPGERRGAQLVNEPGAWAMSALHTADAEACKSFYGELFGWETEPFGDGVTLWRRPGYVGGEPQQPVPRDVVAVMAPLPDGAPPHWAVNFWTDDADRLAATGERLGGQVILAPENAPPFRNTALIDPQGAAFSASQLMLR